MRRAPVFTAYCLLILMAFSAAKYQGWTLFGSSGLAAASAASSGGGGRSGGSSGFHK